MNHIFLKIGRPRCYTKALTAQDVFWLIPGLIRCTGMMGKWRLLFHVENALSVLGVHMYALELLCVSVCT